MCDFPMGNGLTVPRKTLVEAIDVVRGAKVVVVDAVVVVVVVVVDASVVLVDAVLVVVDIVVVVVNGVVTKVVSVCSVMSSWSSIFRFGLSVSCMLSSVATVGVKVTGTIGCSSGIKILLWLGIG